MSTTTREIFWRMEAINKRKIQEANFKASLHGVKLKSGATRKIDKQDFKPLNKNKQKNLDKLIDNMDKNISFKKAGK